MKLLSILFFVQLIVFTTTVFTDYCTPGLCKYQGGDGTHTGCRNNVPHNGKFQSQCPADAVMIEITKDLQKLIVDTHNTQRNYVAGGGLRPFGIRSACRIGGMKWDEELKLTAELHVRECLFAHDTCRNTVNYPLSGQNIGQTRYVKTKELNVTLNILKFMNAWYDEYVDVKQDLIDSFIKYPSPPMTGHFLTTVNERNCRIGCAAVNFEHDAAKNNFMLTCNYPSTSITRGTIYNSCKVPGSGCKSGKHPQYSNLCSTSEVYNMNGLLEFIPYDGSDDSEEDNIDYDTDENDDKDDDDGDEGDDEEADDYELDNDYENDYFPIKSLALSLEKRANNLIVIFVLYYLQVNLLLIFRY